MMEDILVDSKRPHYLIDTVFEWKYGNAAYYATVVVLLIVALAGLLIRNDIFRARWAFIAVALALLPALCEWIIGIRFPWPMKFLLTLALLMHMAGGIFLFYFTLYPSVRQGLPSCRCDGDSLPCIHIHPRPWRVDG